MLAGNQTKEKTTIPKPQNELGILMSISKVIFNLNKGNIDQSIRCVTNKFNDIYSISFNTIISQMIYLLMGVRISNSEIYFNFMKEIQIFEENNKSKTKIFDIFTCLLLNNYTQESNFLLGNMIKRKFIKPKIIKKKKNLYFIHYMSDEEKDEFFYDYFEVDNIEELKKNDWELHKQLIEEGVNPNEIAKIIRNDEIEKLQEISSQNDFDFNQIIKPSLYERCDFVNKENVSLIDYAAFFGSVKCFKYLLLSNSKLTNTGKYAIAGGNLEIIHLCEQNHSSFEGALKVAIKFYRNDIFLYLYENKMYKSNNLEELGKKCILHQNYEIFTFLQKEGMKINSSLINLAARIGNLFLIRYLLKSYQIPKDILVFSSESGNSELVKYVLQQDGIDINAKIYGWTALMFASSNGHTETVKLLLENEEIDVDTKDICLFYLIFVLVIFGNIWNMFISFWTALKYASRHGYTEIVKMILKQKCNRF